MYSPDTSIADIYCTNSLGTALNSTREEYDTIRYETIILVIKSLGSRVGFLGQ
jgi:hypothetical protein